MGVPQAVGSLASGRALSRGLQPNVRRLDPAAQPSLTPPGLNLLQSLFGGQGGGGGQLGPPGANVGQRFGSLFGTGLPDYVSQGLQGVASQNPAQALIGAYQPLFQRNLALAQDTGPRFSSGNELLRSNALSDYNMFAQQAMAQGLQTQLSALLGAGNLSQGFQLPLLQQALGALFQGGGISAAPIYNVSPGWGSQLLNLGGTIAGAAAGK